MEVAKPKETIVSIYKREAGINRQSKVKLWILMCDSLKQIIMIDIKSINN